MSDHNRLNRKRWLLGWELADLYIQTVKASYNARWWLRQEVRAIREKMGKLLARARALATGHR
jgi:hypothetical protein